MSTGQGSGWCIRSAKPFQRGPASQNSATVPERRSHVSVCLDHDRNLESISSAPTHKESAQTAHEDAQTSARRDLYIRRGPKRSCVCVTRSVRPEPIFSSGHGFLDNGHPV